MNHVHSIHCHRHFIAFEVETAMPIQTNSSNSNTGVVDIVALIILLNTVFRLNPLIFYMNIFLIKILRALG